MKIQVVTENQHIVLQTTDGFFLRFPAAEVTEKKKGAIGVRGIRLKKDDALTDVYLFEEGTECKISYHEKEVTPEPPETCKTRRNRNQIQRVKRYDTEHRTTCI